MIVDLQVDTLKFNFCFKFVLGIVIMDLPKLESPLRFVGVRGRDGDRTLTTLDEYSSRRSLVDVILRN